MANRFSEEVQAIQFAKVQRQVQLPGHDKLLELLVQAAYQEGIEVLFHPRDFSKLRYSYSASGEPYGFQLFLKETPRLESRLDYLFDLLHEMGHYWDNEDRPKPYERQPAAIMRQREERAWAYADKQLATFPELQLYREEYEGYKRNCLMSYPVS
jgi:Zn-dependent peptidase ImmA (M78 family)